MITRICFRISLLLASLTIALCYVQTVWAIPSLQSIKAQNPVIVSQQYVSPKQLPLQRISQVVRQLDGASIDANSNDSVISVSDQTGSGPLKPDTVNFLPINPQSPPAVAPAYSALPQASVPGPLPVVDDLVARMTLATQTSKPDSPFYQTTWLTYYGRPNVPVMGILGEYDIESLTRLLRGKAADYDAANGPNVGVKPAFHLVYGMATRGAGFNGSHLVYLEDDVVMAYINRATAEGFAVILDIQIGALSPVDSMRPGFEYLKYPNVHLGIDPEFAMVHPGQSYPGLPIGHITGQQVNAVQSAMQQHMDENGIDSQRILLVHQFIDRMILNKSVISSNYPVALTVSVDGYGIPTEKIRKYNLFTTDSVTEFTAFKLFYRWDEPVLTERQALGIESYRNIISMNVIPNLIIYQ